MGQSWRARLELAWIRGVFALPGMRWLYLRFVWSAGGELEAEFAGMLAEMRDGPASAGDPIDDGALNAHLARLTDIVISKGRSL